MKFNYTNKFYSIFDGAYLGTVGSFGHTADSPEAALEVALDAAKSSRKLWGVRMRVETTLTFSHEP